MSVLLKLLLWLQTYVRAETCSMPYFFFDTAIKASVAQVYACLQYISLILRHFLARKHSEPAKIAYKIFYKIYTCCFIFTLLLLPLRLFLSSDYSTFWTNAYTFLSQSKINLLLLTKARKANTRKNINNACALRGTRKKRLFHQKCAEKRTTDIQREQERADGKPFSVFRNMYLYSYHKVFHLSLLLST